MRVWNSNEYVMWLREHGADIRTEEDLEPRYLSPAGYVGCPVPLEGRSDHVAWITSLDVTKLGGQRPRADAAEWLTRILVEAGGEISVCELMPRYLREAPRHAGVTGVPPSVEQLAMLAYVAGYMGFIEGEYAEMAKLPADHPLAGRREFDDFDPEGLDGEHVRRAFGLHRRKAGG